MTQGTGRPTTTLGQRYELLERLGRGGMGEVWAAHDRRLDRRVAVKLLHRGVHLDAAALHRFAAEARAAARLNHPNVVTVHDSGEHDGAPYLVMELVDGRTLADELAGGRLDEARATAVGLGVLAALEASHAEGVLHRDIKPANVLVGEDGTARLADFGIAKVLDGGGAVTATGIILGTLSYLAPERLLGEPATERSDLYAVGAVLYEALTGRQPYEAESPWALLQAVQAGPPPSLRADRPDVAPALAAAVDRALATSPAERFAGAAEMADALAGGEGRAPLVPPARPAVAPLAPPPVPSPPPPRLDRHPPSAPAPPAPASAATPPPATTARDLSAEVPPATTRQDLPAATRPDGATATPTRPAEAPSTPRARRPRRRPVLVAAAVAAALLGLVAVGRWGDEPAEVPAPATEGAPAPGATLPAELRDAFAELEGAVR